MALLAVLYPPGPVLPALLAGSNLFQVGLGNAACAVKLSERPRRLSRGASWAGAWPCLGQAPYRYSGSHGEARTVAPRAGRASCWSSAALPYRLFPLVDEDWRCKCCVAQSHIHRELHTRTAPWGAPWKIHMRPKGCTRLQMSANQRRAPRRRREHVVARRRFGCMTGTGMRPANQRARNSSSSAMPPIHDPSLRR